MHLKLFHSNNIFSKLANIMRLPALLLFVLLITMPALTVDKAILVVSNPYPSKNVFQNPPKRVGSKHNQHPLLEPVDTNRLKQTAWYAGAIQNIEESEYEINRVQQNDTFTSANRSQNLRATYTPKSLTLQPRKDSIENWDLELSTEGIYAGEKLLYQPDEHPVISQHGNSIQFNHQNNFITEYINSSQGIRQNFIIEKEPAAKTTSLTVKLQVNNGWYINKVHSKEIHFAKAVNNGFDKKLTYNQLKVWDANKKELEASFSVTNNTISINVNTINAVYPLTIDPLSTTANVLLESNQANALMGRYLSSAGDVNGDGFSDVIAGVPLYDDGQTDEGAAFLYYGSSTGTSSTPDIILEANQAGAGFGTGVSDAGDINGDGYGDLLVCALNYDNGQTDEGAAFVYYGSATGITTTQAAILESNQANAHMGFYSDGAGDINGDGYSDIVVGAYMYDNGQTDEGVVFVYHGSATGIITAPAAMLESNNASAWFGREVKMAGDVNGDGYGDIIVGAYGYDNGQTDEGAAFIFQGSATGIITTPALILEGNQNTSTYALSVAGAGDVNGDGYSDIIIGAPEYDNPSVDVGAVFIHYGSATGVNPIPALTLSGNQFGCRFGYQSSSAGDVNGDGYSDIIVGAYSYDNGEPDEGAAFLYYGSKTGIISTPAKMLECNQSDALFGIAAESAGDINGDGYSDLIIGAMSYDNGQTDEGVAFIYHGGPESLSATPLLIDNITQDRASFGITLAGAGDVNGDGYSDVVIGAPLYDDNGADEGRAFVYYGSATGLSTTASVVLDEANQGGANFAFSVAGAGDVNGDGYSDVLVGAWQYNGIGRTYIYFGSAGGLSATSIQQLDGSQGGEGFGVWVSGAGDVNKDGYSDVVIGAYAYDVSGRTDEGRAYVYHGSSSGLNTTPATILNDAGQTGAYFGRVVSSAGDVNGDGYSDILISAGGYDDGANINEGVAYVHYGGCLGVSATADRVLNDANESNAAFGCVSAAGDLNGDGFSDVAVSAFRANGDKGRVFVYYGSSAGLSVSPVVLENNLPTSSAGDWMGYAGAVGGSDVNGDGYSDLLVGVPQWENPGFDNQGRVFVYYGRPSGINTTPDKILADNAINDQFVGDCVAGVGDLNGDGFGDVVIGGDHGSWAGFGVAYVYYGNDGTGFRNNLRLYNTNLSTPMNQANINDATNFGAGLFAKSFIGKQKGKLVWQTSNNGTAFTGSPITNSVQYTSEQAAFANLGLSGAELKSTISKTATQGVTYIRARVKYDAVTAITGQVYGPWRYPAGYLKGNREIAEEAMTITKFRLGNDTTVCFNPNYTINATTAGATSYTWQNGASSSTFKATTTGLYWVEIVLGGCTFRDSIVLSGTTLSTANINPKICQGQTYTFSSGIKKNITGIYKDTLRTKTGCDSIIYNINLVVQTVAIKNSSAFICSGQTYTLPWGKTVNASGIYSDTARYNSGCDSIISNITLTVSTVNKENKSASICAGGSFTLPSGKKVAAPGSYTDTLKAKAGCDSVIIITNLTVLTPIIKNSSASICSGQSYKMPSGRIINASGNYKDTIRYVNGCDSLISNIALTVVQPLRNNATVFTCLGQLYKLPSGKLIGVAGNYNDTLRTSAGCDSIISTFTLNVDAPQSRIINAAICNNNVYQSPSKKLWSVAGIYSDTLHNIRNCDSIYFTITLRVISVLRQAVSDTICSGQRYTLPGGKFATIAGVYADTLRSANGCDSIVTTTLLVRQPVTVSLHARTAICTGDTAAITAIASGGNGSPYTYRWTGVVSAGNTVIVTPVTTSTYGVSVSDGCSLPAATASIIIQSIPAPKPGLNNAQISICLGASATLKAVGGNTYQWSPATGLNDVAIANPIARPVTDTRYKVTVVTAEGCTGYDSLLVRVTQPFTLTASADTLVCAGNSITLYASGAQSYQWTGGNTGASIMVSPIKTTVYTVTGFGKDQCFTQSKNITVTVIALPRVDAGADTTVMVGSSFELKPAYSNDVNDYRWSPAQYLSCTSCATPVVAPREAGTYIITVTNQYQCKASDERRIDLLCNSESVFVPNTFTPNGDGVNDVWYPRGNGIRSVRFLRVFNRWGQVVFERLNFNADDRNAGWNGSYKGQPLPADVYVYSLGMVCDNGQTIETKGNVMIVR